MLYKKYIYNPLPSKKKPDTSLVSTHAGYRYRIQTNRYCRHYVIDLLIGIVGQTLLSRIQLFEFIRYVHFDTSVPFLNRNERKKDCVWKSIVVNLGVCHLGTKQRERYTVLFSPLNPHVSEETYVTDHVTNFSKFMEAIIIRVCTLSHYYVEP